MHLHLLPALALLMLCTLAFPALSQICMEVTSSESYREAPVSKLDLDDVLPAHTALAGVRARSDLDCGRQCVGLRGCVSFAFLSSQASPLVNCKLYGQPPNVTEGMTGFPGARNYVLDSSNMTAQTDACGRHGYGYRTMCGRCLNYRPISMTHANGQVECQNQGQGHIIMLKTVEEFACVKCILEANSKAGLYMWVGADDINQGGDFRWHDGTFLNTTDPVWSVTPTSTGSATVAFASWESGIRTISPSLARTILCEVFI